MHNSITWTMVMDRNFTNCVDNMQLLDNKLEKSA